VPLPERPRARRTWRRASSLVAAPPGWGEGSG
jgi:hypothetical protein